VETLDEYAAMEKAAAEFKGRQAVDGDTQMTLKQAGATRRPLRDSDSPFSRTITP
jgi:hypothetical protein